MNKSNKNDIISNNNNILSNINNFNKINKTLIKKEYKGNKISKIKPYPLYNYNIQTMIEDSKYNVFFILIIQDKNLNNLFLSTYENVTGYFSFLSTFIDYKHYFIYEEKEQKNHENVRYLLVQVPRQKNLNKLTIELCINKYGYFYSYKTDIDIKSEIENYFFINNLNYYSFYYNDYPTLKNNDIFAFFLNYFFKNKDKMIQESLIKALINKIKNSKYDIELKADIILKFFKYCLIFKLELKNINIIKIINQNNYKIPEEYYLSNEDINNFNTSQKEKTKLKYFILIIYAYYNNDFLIKLIQSKDSQEYSRLIFDLLYEKKNKIK